MPLDTLGEYFGIGREDAYYMTFRHPDGSVENNRPLAIYAVNSTYRISSGKFREVPQDERAERPMIVQLARTDEPDTFDVSILRRGTAEFAAAEAYLTQGGGNSKRWGIAA